jgi:Undecaprenyl-phosphate galactose phosphotransferase WbaP
MHVSNENLLAAAPTPIHRRRTQSWLQGYVAVDTIALLLGLFCAANIGVVIHAFFPHLSAAAPLAYDAHRALSFFLLSSGVLLWFQHKGHYRVRMNFWLELNHIISTFAVVAMVDGFFHFAAKQDFSRSSLLVGWFSAALAALILRGLYRIVLRRLGVWKIPTLLIGGGKTADETRAALTLEASMGYEVVGHVKNLPSAFLQAGRSWEKLCAQHGAEHVVIALDGGEMEHAEQPMAQLMRESVPFSISPPRRHYPVQMVPQYFFNYDVKLLTHCSGLEQPLPRLAKRLFDIVVSGTALLVAAPLFIMLALWVRRDGGAAFFGHARLGKNGKMFKCLKFRSMIVNSQQVLERHLAENPDARTEWEETQKLKDDPRVTKVGQFLRSSSLDELPQLFNVLKGEMSLVGPRPIVQDEVQKYEGDIAHYYRVSPGITGLWQVSGRNDVSYAERVQMDSWYVRNWSLWHDVAILCKTIPALMRRSGAY